jgi:competence protein ComEA
MLLLKKNLKNLEDSQVKNRIYTLNMVKQGEFMFHFDRIQQRLLLIIGAGILLLSGFLIYREYGHQSDPAAVSEKQLWEDPADAPQQTAADPEQADSGSDPQPSASSQGKAIKVYITGQVRSKGIITLSEGDRIADAIEMAGGALPDADLNRINLALKVKDEDMVYVPAVGEVLSADTPVSGADSGTVREGRININEADQAQLETLNGIGPAKAQKIIEYREENGGFKTIEEIMNVSGIGEKTFEGLKDQIVTE